MSSVPTTAMDHPLLYGYTHTANSNYSTLEVQGYRALAHGALTTPHNHLEDSQLSDAGIPGSSRVVRTGSNGQLINSDETSRLGDAMSNILSYLFRPGARMNTKVLGIVLTTCTALPALTGLASAGWLGPVVAKVVAHFNVGPMAQTLIMGALSVAYYSGTKLYNEIKKAKQQAKEGSTSEGEMAVLAVNQTADPRVAEFQSHISVLRAESSCKDKTIAEQNTALERTEIIIGFLNQRLQQLEAPATVGDERREHIPQEPASSAGLESGPLSTKTCRMFHADKQTKEDSVLTSKALKFEVISDRSIPKS